MEFEVATPEELSRVSDFLIAQYRNTPIWILNGEMGAGKTTLIKVICESLEVIDVVNSPTFSIVNEYLTERDESIYHFDFYRIEEEKEAVEIGTEEYFDSGSLCLVEWAERVPSLVPPEYIEININLQESQNRNITVKKHG